MRFFKDVKNRWNIYLWIIIILSVVTTIPLLQLGGYNHPAADDYSYSILTHHVWQETHSIWEVIKAARTTSINFWNTWQGLYSSAFVLALQPAIFGEKYYVLTVWLTIGTIYVSNMVFFEYLLHKKLSTSGLEAAAMACVTSSLMVQWMPSALEGLYWYNGAINYTFFFGMMLVFICMAVGLQVSRTVWKRCLFVFVTALLGVLLVGGNHVTAFMGIIFSVGICVVAVWQRKKHFIVESLIVLISMLIGFGINVTSPGTAIRQAALGERLGVFETIWQAVLWGFHFMDEWLGMDIVICMALVFPVIAIAAQKAREKYSFQFRYPLLVLIGSAAWICMMFCPPLYATQVCGAVRLKNVVYFSFVILMFLNEFYLCGWIDVKIHEEKIPENQIKIACISKAGAVTLVVLLLGLYLSAGNISNAKLARNSMINGEAQLYSEIMNARYEVLCNSKGQDVRVEGTWVRPQLLFFSDITADPNVWPNTSVCEYFDLNSVALY